MLSGTVIFFNDIIGEGLIEPDDNSGKIFISYKEIPRTGYRILNEGQRVKYQITKVKGRFYAENVILDDLI
jgi:cold shock protein